MNTRTTGITLLTSLACAVAAYSQTSTTSGAVRGTVKSKKGGAVANANLALRNLETGFTRTVATDAKGVFTFTFMPVGAYELTATAPGLKTMKNSSLRVSLGETSFQNFVLDSAEAAAVVEVVAESAAIDATQINASTSITMEEIEGIPVNGRNFTDLVMLTPGAAENSQGYRTTVDGARGIANNLQIDGASFNSKFNGEQRGGTRIPYAFGMDSIRELQVISNAFDAQYGDASGAVINAVTKTGTNETRGGAYINIRPSFLVANIKPVPYDRYGSTNRPEALKRDYSQTQVGFNIGGPIIKDKLHYFLNVETVQFKQKNTPTVTFGLEGGKLIDFNTFASTAGAAISAHPAGYTLNDEMTRSWENNIKHLTVMGRLDWTVNTSNRLALRLNVQKYRGENDIWNRTIKFNEAESNNSLNEYSSWSSVVEWTSTPTPNLVNEARIQFSTEDRPATPNSTYPGISLPGFNAGQYSNHPSNTQETTTQLLDTLTFVQGNLEIKGGVDLQFVKMKNLYCPDSNGSLYFYSFQYANQWWNGTPDFTASTTYQDVKWTQSYSPLGGRIQVDEKLFAGFIQSRYSGLMNGRLTLNLGARYTREIWGDNPSPNPRLQYLDHMPTNGSLDPRFGFSLDLFGNSRTVLRGGYGHFSTSNVGQNTTSFIMNNGLNLQTYIFSQTPQMPWQPDSQVGMFNTGGPLSRANLFQNGHLVPLDTTTLLSYGNTYGGMVINIADPNAKMAQARSMSLELEQEFGKGWVFKTRATYKKFVNLQYWVDVHMLQSPGATDAIRAGQLTDISYNDGYVSSANSFSSAFRPYAAVVAGRTLDLRGYGAVALSKYDGEGRYKSVILELNKRSNSGFWMKTSLTFARAEDTNSNERSGGTTSYGNTYNPANPLIMARSDNDTPFRALVALGLPTYYGFKASATSTFTAGRPFTPEYSDDLNGDGYKYDPVTELGGRNASRQPNRKTFDFRLTRGFRIVKRQYLDLTLDIFNVFNWANQYYNTTRTYAQKPTSTPYDSFRQLDAVDTRTREVQFTAKYRF